MATTLYLRHRPATEDATSGAHLGTNNTRIDGTAVGWEVYPLLTTAGSGVQSSSATATVAGPTTGVELLTGGRGVVWLSLPIAADVTISGTITANIWAKESNMSANTAINVLIERVTPTGAIASQIVKTTRTAELGTARAAENFTGTPTSTAMTKGDRIRVRVFGDDSTANMASGFTFDIGFSGGTGGADGDTFITFTENISFISADPTGSTLHLTDVAGPAVGAALEKEMWTSFGDGVNTAVVNTANGWTAPIQFTATAGGTAVEWYSKQVSAFTLSGPVFVNLWAHESSTNANCGIRAELASCDNDGSNVTVWSAVSLIDSDAIGSAGAGTDITGELTATTAQVRGYLLAPDLSITDGQRLRLRVFIDDLSSLPLVTGHTATLRYDHTTTGSGDSFITLGQTVTEFTAGTDLVVADTAHGHTVDAAGALVQVHNLTVGDTAHGNTADAVALTQVHTLAGVAESFHGHTVDAIVLAVAVDLTVADAAHAHTADPVTLTQVHNLAVADSFHGHTVDAVTLTQVHALTVADAFHGHTADAVALSQVHVLTVADSAHGHTVDNVTLNVSVNLAVADTAHGHIVEAVTLTQAHNLAVADSFHGHAVEAPALTQVHNLVVADSFHGHTSENVVLAAGGALELADAFHAHTVDPVTLTQVHNLTVADASHGHTSDNVALTQAHTLAGLADSFHAHTVDNVTLSSQLSLTVADSFHAHTVEAAGTLVQVHVLTFGDSLHAHTVEAVTLTQVHVLVVADAFHGHTVDNVSFRGDPTLLRVLYVAAEDRTAIVPAENRTLLVPATARILEVVQ